MAKSNSVDQERIEHDFHNHINEAAQSRTHKLEEQLHEAFVKAAEKAAENAARNRKRKLAREVFRCLLSAFVIACLYLAESAGLIAPVLTAPVYAIAFVSIGWHLCKISRLRGRK